jgi:uroporphyrinogen decarboxylase
MRQAGRYLKEYREIRSKVSFLTLCKTPELAAEVTIIPVKKLGVDAAILFSDILVPIEAMGMPLDFTGSGPVLSQPISNSSDLDKLKVPDPVSQTPFVMDTIRILRKELEGKAPLIGFSGAPFTLASYMVEGGTSANFIKLKTLMFQQPQTLHKLLDIVAKTVTSYVNAQIEAGAQAIQLFDSWAGCLSPKDFQEFALSYSRQVIESLNRQNVPIIYFVQGNPAIISLMSQSGCEVASVDWRIEIGEACRLLPSRVSVQGNLDPAALFLPPEKIRERVKNILAQVDKKRGHIFNLGHGILPQTPVENAVCLVESVHQLSAATN